jgi:hypothetical protein
MDQAASDYVLAVRVLHTGSIIMTHAVYPNFPELRKAEVQLRRRPLNEHFNNGTSANRVSANFAFTAF